MNNVRWIFLALIAGALWIAYSTGHDAGERAGLGEQDRRTSDAARSGFAFIRWTDQEWTDTALASRWTVDTPALDTHRFKTASGVSVGVWRDDTGVFSQLMLQGPASNVIPEALNIDPALFYWFRFILRTYGPDTPAIPLPGIPFAAGITTANKFWVQPIIR